MSFEDVVLQWLRERRPAASIDKVHAAGTDWEGDTEAGFWESFDVTIDYRDENGRWHSYRVAGEELASLWERVVGSWPAVAAVPEAPKEET